MWLFGYNYPVVVESVILPVAVAMMRYEHMRRRVGGERDEGKEKRDG